MWWNQMSKTDYRNWTLLGKRIPYSKFLQETNSFPLCHAHARTSYYTYNFKDSREKIQLKLLEYIDAAKQKVLNIICNDCNWMEVKKPLIQCTITGCLKWILLREMKLFFTPLTVVCDNRIMWTCEDTTSIPNVKNSLLFKVESRKAEGINRNIS